MWLFSRAFPMMFRGDKIRHKKWPLDYYIFAKEDKIFDSNGNVFVEDIEYFLAVNKIVYDAAGSVWELYDDDYEAHL
jgi:hypothetical protein